MLDPDIGQKKGLSGLRALLRRQMEPLTVCLGAGLISVPLPGVHLFVPDVLFLVGLLYRFGFLLGHPFARMPSRSGPALQPATLCGSLVPVPDLESLVFTSFLQR